MRPPFMQEVENFCNVLFVLSPSIGFLPQILSRNIFFPEMLSVLTIIANIMKLLHYSSEPFSSLVAVQALFIIVLHCYLIHFNFSLYSPLEESIFRTLRLRGCNKRYGNKRVYTTIITGILLTMHLMGYVVGSLAFCGVLSLVFELSINVLQVFIERDNKEVLVVDATKKKRSPKELYLFWALGDMVKIWYMVKVNIPKVYLATSVLQLLLDAYLLVT